MLSSLILVTAALVINNQFVKQARAQVQAEVGTLLPLYDAVWNERAQRLAAAGAQLANSPIVKTVVGDARASRDRGTLHEMIRDAGAEMSGGEEQADLIVLGDGAGQVILAEQHGAALAEIREIAAARAVSESQTPRSSFVLLADKLFQLALTPVVLHSGDAQVNNTLAVVGTGVELDRRLALDLKARIHSDVVFLVRDQIHASSLAPELEKNTLGAIVAREVANADAAHPVELDIGGDLYLAFARQLRDFDGGRIGQAVVMRSLTQAGQMFRAISNRLLLLWTLALAAAWLLSYLIAGRITRPIEQLASSVRELGKGNYDSGLPAAGQGEIAQLARAFDQMRRSLRQSQAALLKSERLAAIGQMASSIIHDLRNPLATISTAAEVMKGPGLAPDLRRTMVETQLRASERMNTMLGEILDFTRGSYRLDRRLQPLAAIVGHVEQEFGPQMAKLNVKLETRIPQEILIEADAEHMERVFSNLLVNAAQAMPEGGRIEIGANIKSGQGGTARIDIKDDGPGVPAEVRERLFEPFISHGKQGGTGLGLAIARGIIEAHGGCIWLATEAAHGAHFVIEVPVGSEDRRSRIED